MTSTTFWTACIYVVTSNHMKNIEECSIIVCSIVRNAERGLRANIPVVNALCRHCSDYHVVIYENDSTDKTKDLLRDWVTSDKEHIHVIIEDTDKTKTIPSTSEVVGNPFYSRKRIAKMATLRNKYMEYVDKQGWQADYLVVVDMDVAQLELDGILSSFNMDTEWDAVTAFGYSTSPKLKRRYHDTYALCELGQEDIPQTEITISCNADKYAQLCKVQKPLRVYSAFGGLAIYKFEAVKGLRYEVYSNNDSRVTVRCEHFSICKQMAERGYDKVFINPKMKLKYQHLTLSIAINSLHRRLLTILKSGG